MYAYNIIQNPEVLEISQIFNLIIFNLKKINR